MSNDIVINLSNYNSLLEVAFALNLGGYFFGTFLKEKANEIKQKHNLELDKQKAILNDLEVKKDILKKKRILTDSEKEEQEQIIKDITRPEIFIEKINLELDEDKKKNIMMEIVNFISFLGPVLAVVAMLGLFMGALYFSFDDLSVWWFRIFLIVPLFMSSFVYSLYFKIYKKEKVPITGIFVTIIIVAIILGALYFLPFRTKGIKDFLFVSFLMCPVFIAFVLNFLYLNHRKFLFSKIKNFLKLS